MLCPLRLTFWAQKFLSLPRKLFLKLTFTALLYLNDLRNPHNGCHILDVETYKNLSDKQTKFPIFNLIIIINFKYVFNFHKK